MGQIQTETAYWQPNPNATVPFKQNPMINDPVFPNSSFTAPDVPGVQIPNADGWGLRAVDSTLFLYGVGEFTD
jgi:glucan 1,3-beta-glucosidase